MFIAMPQKIGHYLRRSGVYRQYLRAPIHGRCRSYGARSPLRPSRPSVQSFFGVSRFPCRLPTPKSGEPQFLTILIHRLIRESL
jgi:hypothetical protein